MRVLRASDGRLRVEVLDAGPRPRLQVWVCGGRDARLCGWDQLAEWLLAHGCDPEQLAED